MAEVVFTFNGIQTIIHCNINDPMKDICKAYSIKIQKNLSELIFIYNGNKLSEELTFIQQANALDKERNTMAILVNEIIPDPIPEPVIKQTKQVLCPECGECIKFKIKKYKVKLFGCKNGHQIEKSLNEFKDLLKIDESKIVCNSCKDAKKSDMYNNIFYYCFTCNQNFCPVCKSKHEKDIKHKILDYDMKNFTCIEHEEPYNSYCKKCEKNICLKCIENHDDHEIINYQNILPKKNEKLKECENLRIKIDKMTEYINELFNIFQKIIKNYEIFYEIQMDIINNFDIKNLNYEMLYNINSIDNWNYFKDIDIIINNNTKIKEILEIYQQNDEEEKVLEKEKEKENSIKIKYKVNRETKEKELKIFGETFVINNKGKCNIEYVFSGPYFDDTIKCDLKEKIEVDGHINDIIEITLKGINNITDMSYIFDECKTMLALPDIAEWNTSKITNMSHIFNGCELLFFPPDISNWDTSNVTDMSYMFSGCNSLTSLPDLSKWDISKVENLSFMFSGKPASHWQKIKATPLPPSEPSYVLKTFNTIYTDMKSRLVDNSSPISKDIKYSLKNLPNISKWNTSKVKNIKGIFSSCISLKNLPDISNWNTSNISDMSQAFTDCSSLEVLPNISKWNTSKIVDINSIFRGCEKLKDIPDISKWNTSNLTDMTGIFEGCESLEKLPDISKWNISNVKNISRVFINCKLLEYLPDISKWNTSKVENMSHIFSGCESLISLPDISIWDTSNVNDLSCIFNRCKLLRTLPDISQWNTTKNTNMERIFECCQSLISLPDISKWCTYSVTKMNFLFDECRTLNSLPDISKWDTHNVTDMSYMFCNCKSLISLPDISIWDYKKLQASNSIFEGCSKNLNIPKQFKGCIVF